MTETSTQCFFPPKREVVHVTEDITWPYMEALQSSLPTLPPPHWPHWEAPDSQQHNVLCDNYRGGKKSTKSQKNASDFKPNQPLMKHRGLFPRLPLNCSRFLQTGWGGGVSMQKWVRVSNTPPSCITSPRLVFPSTWGRRSSQHSWHRSRYGGNYRRLI